jgi:hypothetical protein
MHQRDFGASFLCRTASAHHLRANLSAQFPKLRHLLLEIGGESCEVGNSFNGQ